MKDQESNVTSIDQPRCCRCGSFKKTEELNGYDPLAPIGQKYKAAYCRNLAGCKSDQAKKQIDNVIDQAD